VTQRIGKRAPLYCTGIGKLLLTNYSEQELEDYYRDTKIVGYTEKTITTLQELKAELDKIREQGFAIDDGECDIGASCVAAPVRDYRGVVVAGLSITAPSLRLTPERINSVIPVIRGFADELSRALAYSKK
jgi:IclR family KDG regulon transcriptional repressor